MGELISATESVSPVIALIFPFFPVLILLGFYFAAGGGFNDDDDDDLKERKKRPESQGASRLEPQKLKEDEFDQVEEDMVEESEEGEEVVKESDDQWYQSELFENLKKKWTK